MVTNAYADTFIQRSKIIRQRMTSAANLKIIHGLLLKDELNCSDDCSDQRPLELIKQMTPEQEGFPNVRLNNVLLYTTSDSRIPVWSRINLCVERSEN